MFGIFKKIQEINEKIDRLLVNDRMVRFELAVEKFKSTHKPIFKEGDVVGDFTIYSGPNYSCSDNHYDSYNPVKSSNFGMYAYCFYGVKNKNGMALFGPGSMSEYELYKIKNNIPPDKFIKLTTKNEPSNS